MADAVVEVAASAAGRSWLRIAATLFGLFWGFFFYGLIDLMAFAQGEQFHAALLLSTGWGLVFLFLVAGPLGCPERAGVRRISVSACPGGAGRRRGRRGSRAQLFTPAPVRLSRTYRHGRGAGGSRARSPLERGANLALVGRSRGTVILAVAPCCAYAWTSARTTGGAQLTDDTWGLDHWPVQAALPLISALAAGHPCGWRLPTWSAGTAAAWFAAVCWLEPDLVASVSRPWAAITLLWSAAFIAATHLSARDAAR
jgi:hypothetical protein